MCGSTGKCRVREERARRFGRQGIDHVLSVARSAEISPETDAAEEGEGRAAVAYDLNRLLVESWMQRAGQKYRTPLVTRPTTAMMMLVMIAMVMMQMMVITESHEERVAAWLCWT